MKVAYGQRFVRLSTTRLPAATLLCMSLYRCQTLEVYVMLTTTGTLSMLQARPELTYGLQSGSKYLVLMVSGIRHQSSGTPQAMAPYC